jgi:DNA-binding NarL/FixJ family response regulator
MSRALIVSTQDRAPLVAVLHSGGFEVLTALDCGSACQQLESSPPTDLVVADLNLPDGNWCTLLRELRDRELDARLLVCADRAERLHIIEVVQRGGEYALARSYAPESVGELLKAA